ncbi:MAG: ABC transporter ATP-binding protein [Pseudoalteromonas sp.]|uniref:ABC transporter ATP-binding protein n=1 Tax=unclassified Pseudoalteromonas TaxID=194690 RepID=UPI000C07269D|nr:MULTISPECIES: ATP-binding cassette domain-containing protein [unclassified Pseudoalteromonas]MDP2633347.1 ATP-binding cassette domain-containing protein [Pseudoalteromonas sp. 1_MG-2023]PHN91685.1 ABC transporter ATP-binding protein [Pseudoalteromonas sp. 3D05]
MIEISHLSKSFGDNNALNDLCLSIPAGQVTCLLGANGAGKSTTLNLLLNFIAPDSGRITIDNIDVQMEPEKSKQKLVYLPEQVNLFEEFNAIENLQYLASLTKQVTSNEQVEDALIQTGLQKSAWLKPLSSYSKGMRQKVGIAFAILRQAKVLLLDEPTSGLDPSATREFIKIIELLAHRGAAILMVTHDLYCAHSLAKQIGIMKQGKLCTLLDNNTLTLDELEAHYHHIISGDPLPKPASLNNTNSLKPELV